MPTETIIALMAMAGVVSAAPITETLWTMDFGNDIGGSGVDYKITNGSTAFTYNPTISGVNQHTTADQAEGHWTNGLSGVVTSPDSVVTLSGSSGITWGDDFQFVITFTMPDGSFSTDSHQWPVNAQLGQLENNGNTYALRFGPYIEEQNEYNLDGHITGTVYPQSKVQLTGGEHVAVLTVIDRKITLTLDGVGVATSTCGDDLGNEDTISLITLGGDHKGTNRLYSSVKSVSMSKIIPEPTTATLSLLALAGLAARRRRK